MRRAEIESAIREILIEVNSLRISRDAMNVRLQALGQAEATYKKLLEISQQLEQSVDKKHPRLEITIKEDAK